MSHPWRACIATRCKHTPHLRIIRPLGACALATPLLYAVSCSRQLWQVVVSLGNQSFLRPPKHQRPQLIIVYMSARLNTPGHPRIIQVFDTKAIPTHRIHTRRPQQMLNNVGQIDPVSLRNLRVPPPISHVFPIFKFWGNTEIGRQAWIRITPTYRKIPYRSPLLFWHMLPNGPLHLHRGIRTSGAQRRQCPSELYSFIPPILDSIRE